MKKRNGFSLIELLAIVSIMSIIFGFALPSFQSVTDKLKSDSVAEQLYHHLYHARIESITKNIVTTVCASLDKQQCIHDTDWSNHDIIIFQDKNNNGNIDTNEPIISVMNLGLTQGTLKWKSFGNKPYLQWQPSGMTYYQNGNFTYCPKNHDEHYAKRIILNTAGRIYFGYDRNHDGIQEGTNGKNIQC